MDSMRPTLPATRPASAPSSNAFVGRQHELAELTMALQRHRLVTITGTGGVGKTRLALELTEEYELAYPDGVHVVRLAAIQDESGAIQAIARSMQISGVAEQLDRDIRAALKRGRHLLLLDNLEHLNLQELIASFLVECPDLTILATSRGPLRLDDESVMNLTPFLFERPATSDIAALRHEPAIELFCRRASEAPRPVLIFDQQLPQVAEICRRVDGLPLAIELVVGWMRLLTPDELLNHLDRVLPRLRGAATAEDARHQTMALTIAWSYDLLSGDEQRLFRRMAAFAGGFSIDMAIRMAAGHSGRAYYPYANGYNVGHAHSGYLHFDPAEVGPFTDDPTLELAPVGIDVIDGLQALEEAGLIQRVASADGDSRYDLLEVIREFGIDQLREHAEFDTARHAQAAIVLAFVEMGHEGIFYSSVRRWSDARLDQELPNLRQALTWSNGRGESGAELFQRIAGASWMFWQSHGLVTEGRRWLEASYQYDTDYWSQAMQMPALGFLCWIQGDDARAEAVLLEAVERANRAGFIATEASGYLYLALVAWRGGPERMPEMIAHLTHSMALYQTIADPVGLGICTHVFGIIDRLTGNPQRALERFEKARVYFEVNGFDWGIASATYYAADATLELAQQNPARYPESLRLFEEALNGYFASGDWWGLGGVIAGVATAATYLGDQALAARLFGYSSALLGIVGAYLPPANLEFYQAIADHLRGQMGDERFMIAYQQGMAFPASEALTEGEQALSALRLRLTQLAHLLPEPLPKLMDAQKRMVQQLVDGNPPKRIAELTGRTLASVYQMLKRICKRWGITTWEEIAPLAISRDYTTPTPREDLPSRKGWSK